MAELKTRVVLRNDSSANWTAAAANEGETKLLLKGEIGIEFDANNKAKIKVGDGVTGWDSLNYFGGEEAKVFVKETFAELEALTNLSVGDMGIVKALIAEDKYSYTSYVYNGAVWEAMDGNYNADNVYLKDSIVLAGNYTSIGNYSKGDIINAGTSLQALLSSLLTQRLQPSITNPSASILFTNVKADGSAGDEVEIGTTYTATYKTNFADGKFTYDEVTGCQSTEATVKFNGQEIDTIEANGLNGATGEYEVVINNTNTKVFQLIYGWTESTITPKDNLGDPATENTKIAAASNKSVSSTKGVTGYRNIFGGSYATAQSLNSKNIRALGNKTKSTNNTFSVTIDEGAKQVIIAVPDGRKVTKVADEGAFGTDIFEKFVLTEAIAVGGADATADNLGNYSMNYNVYVYSPATALGANTYIVTIANE